MTHKASGFCNCDDCQRSRKILAKGAPRSRRIGSALAAAVFLMGLHDTVIRCDYDGQLAPLWRSVVMP